MRIGLNEILVSTLQLKKLSAFAIPLICISIVVASLVQSRIEHKIRNHTTQIYFTSPITINT